MYEYQREPKLEGIDGHFGDVVTRYRVKGRRTDLGFIAEILSKVEAVFGHQIDLGNFASWENIAPACLGAIQIGALLSASISYHIPGSSLYLTFSVYSA